MTFFIHISNRCLAIDIEHGTAVTIPVAKLLGIQVFHILDDALLVVEQCIQKANKSIIVQFGAEQLFESEVGVRIDVSLASLYSHVLSLLLKTRSKEYFLKQQRKRNSFLL